jgi:excisionase family DNA binding protein
VLTREDVLTAAEVAELLKVPVSTVRYWASRGEVPSHKLGKHRRYVRGEVIAWLEQR